MWQGVFVANMWQGVFEVNIWQGAFVVGCSYFCIGQPFLRQNRNMFRLPLPDASCSVFEVQSLTNLEKA